MKTSAITTAWLVCALALGACSKRESNVTLGNRTQVLHLGNAAEPNDLDPQTADTINTGAVIMALFEGLAQYDPKSCEPIPAAAERWEVAADNLTWTFHLRHTGKWSNGDPVTARDFVFAYQRILSPKLGAEYAYFLYALKNGEAFNTGKITDPTLIGAHAADDYTLVLTLDHPVPFLPAMVCHTAWYPLHRVTVEKFGLIDQRGTRWTQPGNLVGNGYFTLTEWKSHQHIRVTKSQTYWDRDNVKLNEVYFYPIESSDGEERAFRSGQLHITSRIPLSKIAVYEKEQPEFLDPGVYLATTYFQFNTAKPPFTDPRVRRALSMAVDRERIVHDVTRGHQVPATTFSPPNIAGFTAKGGLGFDLPAAKKLLADAGFPDGKGFPKLELTFPTNESSQQIVEAVQQMWRKGLGIEISLHNQEMKVLMDSMHSHNYELSAAGWVGDYLDASTFLDMMAGDSGNNFTGWKNPEYDRLVALAKSTPDQAKRYAYYQRCEDILTEECPIAPIYFNSRNNLRRPAVKGYYNNLLDEHMLKGVHLDPTEK